jgi:Xaa-Pro aminopeptidase
MLAEPGMVLTVEPIFWDLPDAKIGNFAMEEVVLVTETGHEVLSTFSNDLYVL